VILVKLMSLYIGI